MIYSFVWFLFHISKHSSFWVISVYFHTTFRVSPCIYGEIMHYCIVSVYYTLKGCWILFYMQVRQLWRYTQIFLSDVFKNLIACSILFNRIDYFNLGQFQVYLILIVGVSISTVYSQWWGDGGYLRNRGSGWWQNSSVLENFGVCAFNSIHQRDILDIYGSSKVFFQSVKQAKRNMFIKWQKRLQ